MLIQKKIQTGFAVALAFLLVTGVSAWWSQRRNVETFHAVERTYAVLDELEATLVGMLSTEVATRSFAMSGDGKFLTPSHVGISAVRKSFQSAKRLTLDEPGQQRRMEVLEPLIEQEIRQTEGEMQLLRSGDSAGAIRLIASGQETTDQIRRLIGEMENEEEQNLKPLTEKAGALSRMTITVVGFGGLLSLGLVTFAGITVGRDFEKRRRAEEELRASEERHRLLISESRDAIMTLSPPDWRFTSCNPATLGLFGVGDESQFCALGPWEVSPDVQPDGRASAEKAVAMIETAMREGSHFFEWTHRRLDGWPFAATVLLSRIEQGGQSFLQATVRDITAQKTAEEASRSLNAQLEALVAMLTTEMRQALLTLDATEDAAFIFDPVSLCFTRVNAGAVRQLGYTREELQGMKPGDISPQFDEAVFRERVAPILRGEVPSSRFTTVHRHRDGHLIPVEINVQYVAPAGEQPRFVGIARDITERLQHERMAQRSQRLEAIGTLAGGVAHDLNNALSPIVMGMELLRVQYPGESAMADVFEASARRATDMVRQLLAFAKGAGGERISLRPERLVAEVESLMRRSFPKEIELVFACEPALPAVMGDATQLHQVLLNLCVNARDAMPRGGTLKVEASVREVDAAYARAIPDAEPGRYVMLRVSDTGTGIAPEILDRIFDPFFTTKGPDKGTGLGLSTATGIVKGHGGFLQVYSQPGKGTTFAVCIPAGERAVSAEPADCAGPEFCGNGEMILFVDDEASVREMACMILKRLNFAPLTASDGAGGLAQAERHRDGLRAVLTDLHMPRMDGLAFVRELRRMLPGIPVAVCSGRLDESVAGEFQAMGVTARLDKPFTVRELAEVLKKLLVAK
jgi:PAS domain S-box-containing protein